MKIVKDQYYETSDKSNLVKALDSYEDVAFFMGEVIRSKFYEVGEILASVPTKNINCVMEIQKLTRQGLKEIHAIACESWKKNLETFGTRNPLEDYIELTQTEVGDMFNACTTQQIPVVEKHLKRNDGVYNKEYIYFYKSFQTYKLHRIGGRYAWIDMYSTEFYANGDFGTPQEALEHIQKEKLVVLKSSQEVKDFLKSL